MHRRRFLQVLAGSLLTRSQANRFCHAWAQQPASSGVSAASPQPTSPAANLAVHPITLNQVGYAPAREKIATIVCPEARAFTVHSTADNAVAFRSDLGPERADAASGDRLRSADFSALRAPGEYTLALDTGERSAPFRIAPDVYRDALRLTMRAYYGQRCGCAVDLGGGYQHPPCHLEGAYHATSGKSGPFPNHGGWHDAGDYGRYVVNSGITMGTLLWAWEFFATTLGALALAIPESGGKIPDYLAEVRWNLNWALALQDADGGVWHKQTSEQFCGFVMPQDDHLVSYVIGTGAPPYKSTGASADLAAVAAIAARVYGPYDAAFAQQCLAAARRAWTWCARYPNVTFNNPPGIGTGNYEDADCGDELAWAAAELWRTTGEESYRKAFEAAWSKRATQAAHTTPIAAPSWGDVGPMAAWTYLLSERKGDARLQGSIRASTLASAEALLAQSRQNGYGNTLAERDYIWGSNSVAGNHSLLLLIADRLHADPRWSEAALANLHYLLGRNCLGLSWVTQVGSRPFQHPHHRPSIADGIEAPWPGLLSGGPNAHPGDAVLRTLPPAPPMRMYIDNDRAYSCNEVAINWNAPLVFLLAAV